MLYARACGMATASSVARWRASFPRARTDDKPIDDVLLGAIVSEALGGLATCWRYPSAGPQAGLVTMNTDTSSHRHEVQSFGDAPYVIDGRRGVAFSVLSGMNRIECVETWRSYRNHARGLRKVIPPLEAFADCCNNQRYLAARRRIERCHRQLYRLVLAPQREPKDPSISIYSANAGAIDLS